MKWSNRYQWSTTLYRQAMWTMQLQQQRQTTARRNFISWLLSSGDGDDSAYDDGDDDSAYDDSGDGGSGDGGGDGELPWKQLRLEHALSGV